MEQWDLYDRDRKKTGKKMIRGEKIPTGFYHLVVSVWVKNSEGNYLMSKRCPDKKMYPGYWECTGGCVVAGEDSLQGALREVHEELGISLNPEEGTCLSSVCRESMRDFYDVWLFPAEEPEGGLKLQREEVESARWMSREEIECLDREGCLHPLLSGWKAYL